MSRAKGVGTVYARSSTQTALAIVILILMVSSASAGLTIHTGLSPQKFVLDRIAGEASSVNAILSEGQSPHSFEPTAAQVSRMVGTDVYFESGLLFEESLLRKLRGLSPGTTFIGLPRGTLPVESEDMHWWLDPRSMAEFATNAALALGALDPEQAPVYRARADSLAAVLSDLDAELRQELAPYAGSRFYVFHPAFGHFAAAYGLTQRSIESGGHEPGARELVELAENAKAEGARTVFVQPQFPTRSATVIARELGGSVVPIDPLAYDYIQNLRAVAAAIRKSFGEGTRGGTQTDGQRNAPQHHQHEENE